MSKTKPKSKSKSHRKPAPGKPSALTGLAVLGVTKTDGIAFAKVRTRVQAYQDIREKLKTIKIGESVIVAVPQGITADVAMNRLNACFKRQTPEIPKGSVLRKRKTEDGRIALICAAAEK